MVIRNVQAPNVQKTKQVQGQTPAAPAAGEQLKALTDLVDRALVDGNFSQNEARRLEDGIKQNPALKGQVADHLKAALEKANGEGKPVSVSEMALSKLSGTLGVDFKELFFRRQAQSKTVDHEVAGGLEKQAKTVADEHSVEKHKAASDTRIANQKAILDGKKGVVDRPIGGSKGAAYDAALVLAQHAETKLDEKLSPEAKAAKDVLREPLVKTGNAVIAEAIKNPDTMKSLSDVASSIGQEGFKEALGTAASNIGKHIVDATNMTAVNTDAVEAFVSGTTASVDKLSKLAKGLNNPTVDGALAKAGPKVTETVAGLGAKLTGSATAATKTAQTAAQASSTAATAASTAATAAKTAQTAAQVGTVAAETAQVAGAGAKVAGQSVPVLGQALGVVTTGLAAAEFIGQCKHSPRDWKRVLSAGLNVVGQAVGIFIPFVGAATTGVKLASDAAMNAHDKKHGREAPKTFNLADHTPAISNATNLAGIFLDGAGHGEASTKIRAYSRKLETLAEKGMSSAELASMPAAEREAMMQTLAACQGEAEKLATEAKGTPNEAAARLLGEAYRGLMATWRKSKNVDNAEDPEAEKKKLAGEAMEAAGKAAAAEAIVQAAEKKGV